MTQPPKPPSSAASPTALRTAALSHRRPTAFHWQPGAGERAALAAELGLITISALDFRGAIHPEGRTDFRLEGRLLAEVVQPCVVTLAPVPASLDEPVLRRYLADPAEPAGDEAEMPEDDSIDPLPATIDLTAVAIEALVLALPPYPRAPGAGLGEGTGAAAFGPPGSAPLRDDDLKPFAALAALAPARKEK